jgi:mRNA interferase MazF
MPNPGDLVVAAMPGAVQGKRRPGVVLSSTRYHNQRPDVIVGLVTTNTAVATATTDHVLLDWQQSGLTKPSAYRSYLSTVATADCQVIGHLSVRDWEAVQTATRRALEI